MLSPPRRSRWDEDTSNARVHPLIATALYSSDSTVGFKGMTGKARRALIDGAAPPT